MSPPGFWELVALAVLALLIFGPDKLPGIARTVGKGLTQFKREAQSTVEALKDAAELEELKKAAGELEELKNTAGELKAASEAVQREATLVDEEAPAPSRAGVSAGESQAGPPPFDPDAT